MTIDKPIHEIQPLPNLIPIAAADLDTRLTIEDEETERRIKLRTIKEDADQYLAAAKSLYHSKQFGLALDEKNQPFFVQVAIEKTDGDNLSVEMPVVLPLSFKDKNEYAVSPGGTVYIVGRDKDTNSVSLSTISEPLEANISRPNTKGKQYPLCTGAVDYATRKPGEITSRDYEMVSLQDGSGNVRIGMVFTSDKSINLDTIHNNLQSGLKRVATPETT